MSGLPRDVAGLLSDYGGVIDTATAVRCGLAENRLRNLARAGKLFRLGSGMYVPADGADGLDDWAQFRLRARAFATSVNAYLTGWGATVWRGLPTLGSPPSVPTVVRPRDTAMPNSPGAGDSRTTGSGSSRSSRGRILVEDLPPEHQFHKGTLPIVSKAWAVADVARTARLPDSLVVADQAKRRGWDLAGVLPCMRRWAGISRAVWVVEQALPTVESPLETLGRFTFIEYGLPMPVTNAWVGRGRPEWRLDGLLPWHGWGYEGDGAVKYDNRDDASAIVRAQQEREFQLRRLGLDLVRYTWPDVYPSRQPLADKLRAMFNEHPVRSGPVKWWKDVPGYGPVEPRQEDWPSVYPSNIVLPAGWRSDMDGLRQDDDESD